MKKEKCSLFRLIACRWELFATERLRIIHEIPLGEVWEVRAHDKALILRKCIVCPLLLDRSVEYKKRKINVS